jgi:obg-like ATPase 1
VVFKKRKYPMLNMEIITIIFLYYRLPKLKEWIDANDPGAMMIPFSGAFEGKIADMDVDARKAFCEENKANSTFEKIIVQGYKCLHLMYFFTAGHDEVKAWSIQVCGSL